MNYKTILQSNTFVQNILIMGFTKWLVNVYKYFKNSDYSLLSDSSNSTIRFIAEFNQIFEYPKDDYVQFCKNINKLLLTPDTIVKNLGNYCQVLDSDVYPQDTKNILIKRYIEKEMAMIRRIWKETGTQTFDAWRKDEDEKANIGSSSSDRNMGMGMNTIINSQSQMIPTSTSSSSNDIINSNKMTITPNEIGGQLINPKKRKTKHNQKQEKHNHKYTIKRDKGNKRN
jgi:hypothetical protein